MKNSKKIAAVIMLMVLSPTAASASGLKSTEHGLAQQDRCRMDFRTPWSAFQYIPCLAGFFSA